MNKNFGKNSSPFYIFLYSVRKESKWYYLAERKCMNGLSSVYSTHEIFAEACDMR